MVIDTRDHKILVIPGTDTNGWLSRFLFEKNTFKIKIKKDNKCNLKPREQTFILTLLNEKMERVYNSSGKIVLPQCGEKPVLVIIPNPFELERY